MHRQLLVLVTAAFLAACTLNRQLPEVADEEAMLVEVRAAIASAVAGKTLDVHVEVSPTGLVTLTGFTELEFTPSDVAAVVTQIAALDVTAIVIDGKTYYSRPEADPSLPPFPWPPPTPSGVYEIPKSLLNPKENITVGHVVNALNQALSLTGYDNPSIFAAPGGIALVTRIEQIDQDGAPLPGKARWNPDIPPIETFSLSSYFRALLSGRQGYYRAMVLVVTTSSVPLSGKTISESELKKLAASGALATPLGISRQRLLPEHRTWALVYEFERGEADEQPIVIVPGRLTAQQHLERAGILKRLGWYR